ncbi:hypothetical protein L1887_45978 [Cichorium endivia]|nr:hypothetical protein L1887_45978 [Cichorium endivia]
MERDFTVVFRVRPSLLDNPSPTGLVEAASTGELTINEPRTKLHTCADEYTPHTFLADASYLAASTSDDIFRAHIAPLIPFVLTGGFATVLAYGQTGSGKTHTLSQCSRLAISALVAANADSCHMEVCAIELYGKVQNDLLDASNTRVMVAETLQASSTFARATLRTVSTADELLSHVEAAWSQRITRGTEKNPHSSRSHALIRIICRSKLDANATPGVLQLVDLAGSERAADHSPAQAQARMAETVAINTSLMTLKQCIRARTSPAPSANGAPPHIPFRSSKLTLALKEAFDLYARQPTHTVFIATASPDLVDQPATLNTLRYAAALVAAPHARIHLQPDPQGRNIFFWTPARLAEWILKYASPFITPANIEALVQGQDGAAFARVPEQQFYARFADATAAGKLEGKAEAKAKEVYLKWWKLVIASRTISQKALADEWKKRHAAKLAHEAEEEGRDAEVQRLLRLEAVAKAPEGVGA